ncbi:MAG: adenosine deaminase [Candidatus Hinthialibacter antarcticus]|nr:adenosine deaminase [Candidatus Hinthialibacter antarcticus]
MLRTFRNLFFRPKPKQTSIAKPPSINESDRAFIEAIPKVEIHLHFEGAIHAQTILKLAKKQNVEEIRTFADAQWALYFQNPHEFFQKFLFISGLLRSPDDFRLAAYDLGAYLDQQNIRYVELTFAPHKFMMAGMEYASIMNAIDEGLREAPGSEKRSHRFVIDIVRDLGPEAGMRVIKTVEENPNPLVVGVGLGGGENYPPEQSKEVFEYAAGLGLRKTAHAGEGLGANSIWRTLESLKPERLDHGVRAHEDEKLVAYLAENKIPLNLCLTSNVMLGVVTNIENHPFKQYDQRGIPVNLSTDDPPFFRTTLNDEFANLVQYHGYKTNEFPRLIQNALQASFLDDDSKQKLSAEITRETDALAQSPSTVSEPASVRSGR